MENLLSFFVETRHYASFFQALPSLPTAEKIRSMRKALVALERENWSLSPSWKKRLRPWIQKTREDLLREREKIEKEILLKTRESSQKEIHHLQNLSLDLWELQGRLFHLLAPEKIKTHSICRPGPGRVEALVVLEPSSKAIMSGFCASLRVEKKNSHLPSNFTTEATLQIQLAKTTLRYFFQNFSAEVLPCKEEVLKKLEDLDLLWNHHEMQNLTISGQSLGLAVCLVFLSELWEIPLSPSMAFSGKIELPEAALEENLGDPCDWLKICEIQRVGGIPEKVESLFWNRPWLDRIFIPRENLEDVDAYFSSHPGGLIFCKESGELRMKSEETGLRIEGVSHLKEVIERCFGNLKENPLFHPQKTSRLKRPVLLSLSLVILLLVIFFWTGKKNTSASPLELWIQGKKVPLKGKTLSLFSGEKLAIFEYEDKGFFYLFQREGERAVPLVNYWREPHPKNPTPSFSLKSFSSDRDWFVWMSDARQDKQRLSQILSTLSQPEERLKSRIKGLGSLSQESYSRARVRWNLYQLSKKGDRAKLLVQVDLSHLPLEIYRGSSPVKLPLSGNLEILPSREKLFLKMTKPGFLMVFARRGQQISLLKHVQKNPSNWNQPLCLHLRDFKKDEEWFFLFRKKLPSSEKCLRISEKLLKIPSIRASHRGFKEESPSLYLSRSITRWSLYTEEGYLLSEIWIYRLPFLIEFFVKNPSNREFEPFLPEKNSVREGDKIQWRVRVFEKIHLSIFLKDPLGKVQKVYSSGDPVRSGEILTIPSQEGFVFDSAEGPEYLVCFYGPQKLKEERLSKWLKQANLGKEPKNNSIINPPAPFLLTKIMHRK